MHKRAAARQNRRNFSKYKIDAKFGYYFREMSEQSDIVFEGSKIMSIKTQSYIKSAAIGAAAGGLAFWAARSLTSSKRMRRKAAAKAVKVVGSLMDSL